MSNERIPCKQCEAMILPNTYKRNDGLCALCARGVVKYICDVCSKETTAPAKVNGKILCLGCNKKQVREREDKQSACSKYNKHSYSDENMEVKFYPEFDQVFVNQELRGLYYPLCTVRFNPNITDESAFFHLVSHNGLWINPEKSSNKINLRWTRFAIQQGKYMFHTDLSVFGDIHKINTLHNSLQSFFEKNKQKYTQKEISANQFKEEFLTQDSLSSDSDIFDLYYYLEAFYEFSIRKEKYLQHHSDQDFIPVNQLSDNKLFSPYFSEDFINIAEELIVNNSEALSNLIPIGACWGDRFFEDGNNCFLFIDPEKKEGYCVNQYS